MVNPLEAAIKRTRAEAQAEIPPILARVVATFPEEQRDSILRTIAGPESAETVAAALKALKRPVSASTINAYRRAMRRQQEPSDE